MIKYVFLVSAVLNAGSATDAPNPKENLKQSEQNKENDMVDKLQITDNTIGDGAEAVVGQLVTVHYTGRLTDGTKFDSSVDRGRPFSFMLGVGQVIKGWDEGVVGMKVGGKRSLLIPAHMAYGSRGAGSIPPNAPLEFDVELISIEG